ncbi:MAG: GxGYxYP family putative glycoside hydrolase [Dysgonomonas sp.]|nr:GxGYxYP family putative glycoside hydrolase [Dysgonomonas sp.]
MKKLLVLISWALIFCAYGCGDDSEPVKETPPVVTPPKEDTIKNTQVLKTGIVHQKGFELKTLNIISGSTLSDEQKVLVATLQGLAAKNQSEQIYIDEGGPSSVWKDYLKTYYKVSINNKTFTELISRYKALGVIKGYIVYNRATNKRSVNAATSLCGAANAIAVDKSIENDIILMGVTNKILDVTGKTEKWAYENYPLAFTKKNAAELSPDINHHLRDYIALTNAFTFYDGITDWRTSVLKDLDPGAYCFGYGEDEFKMVENASQQGISMLPTDMAANLAPLSSIYNTEGLKQRAPVSDVTTEENVHYVTFLVSDGDNIAYNLWSQQSYFDNSIRGEFAVGYTITPSLYDLAPVALRWYFDKSTTNDYFVCGPSGSSYIFPSRMPADKLSAYTEKLNEFASKTGLTICNILDQGAINKMDVWDKYLSQPNIDALIYTGYGESPKGSIQFSSNGKPIIEQRDNLWEGLEEESTVIKNINSRPADPYSKSGYTLVFVHTWTKDLSNIKTVVGALNPNVRVVTPDVFVKLVSKNLKE